MTCRPSTTCFAYLDVRSFPNWNVGRYDLATPVAVIERGVKHKYVELGFGLTVR